MQVSKRTRDALTRAVQDSTGQGGTPVTVSVPHVAAALAELDAATAFLAYLGIATVSEPAPGGWRMVARDVQHGVVWEVHVVAPLQLVGG